MKHWLVTATAYGEISADQVRELSEDRKAIFPCGKCSGPDDEVFHNVLGRHNHWRPWEQQPC